MICCSLYQKRDPKPQKSDMHGGDPSAVKEYLQNRRRRKRHRDSLPFQKVLAEVPKHPDHRLEFARLGIQPHSAEALEHNSFDTPTQSQRSAIPAFLSGQHCTLMAETGSGKTLAYALPSFTEVALSRADKSKTPGYCCPSVVVVVPTQELATQTGHFVNFAAQVCTPENCKREYFVHVLAGKEKKLLKPLERRRQKAKSRSDGKSTSKSEKLTGTALEYFRKFEAADGVVGTPQRLLSLIRSGFMKASHVRHIVFDEADLFASTEMERTARNLLRAIGGKELQNGSGCPIQLAFACATLDSGQWASLRELVPGNLKKVETAGHRLMPESLESIAIKVEESFESRMNALISELDRTDSPQVLIFVNSIEQADKVAQRLQEADVPATSFHGKRGDKQDQLAAFENMEVTALVSTDLGARGIDLPNVFLIVEFEVPDDYVMHLHRAGRTGRTGQTDVQARAVLLYSESDSGPELDQMLQAKTR